MVRTRAGFPAEIRSTVWFLRNRQSKDAQNQQHQQNQHQNQQGDEEFRDVIVGGVVIDIHPADQLGHQLLDRLGAQPADLQDALVVHAKPV
ncbi:hypothetical protein EYF80_044668 [Liparis tanakae]|uniref:Uncharacterized protein n=1 Tax=Liparis tanakae TaxID=230148 RepID=A0A4Z2FVB7_9TELE|nr:hypothetical protein EYF80_044668 [Liparis tanakae]